MIGVFCTVYCVQGCLYTGSPSRQIIEDCVFATTQEHRAWQADSDYVAFSGALGFDLWNHDGCIRVKRFAGQRCVLECIIERKPGVMILGAISCHGQSNLFQIKGNINSNIILCDVLQHEVVCFLQGIPGTTFQQDNARSHVTKTVRDFCSSQHMQHLH